MLLRWLAKRASTVRSTKSVKRTCTAWEYSPNLKDAPLRSFFVHFVSYRFTPFRENIRAVKIRSNICTSFHISKVAESLPLSDEPQ